jgi:hypothetical protein
MAIGISRESRIKGPVTNGGSQAQGRRVDWRSNRLRPSLREPGNPRAAAGANIGRVI